MCSICMEYGHVEANCHDQEEDTDSDLEWEELEVQSEAEELLSQEEESWQCPEPLPRQFTGGDDPLMEELRPHPPEIFWGGRGQVVDYLQQPPVVLLTEGEEPLPPSQPEGEEPLPPSQPEGEEPLPPLPLRGEEQELPLPPPPPLGEVELLLCVCGGGWQE
ncbi:UNVERIFIED_CONTAM: hypothetical protein FKN15_028374 [Acipenser sinensis]